MIFTEGGFAIFLPIVFAGWLVLRRRDGFALAWLLLSSLIFYGYHRWWTVTILLGYALVDWSIGLWLPRTKRPGIVLATGLGFNLLVLSCWKYTPLLLDSAAALFGRPWLRLDPLSSGNWFVPIGISFYSFSGISYMVDVHRGSAAPEPSFMRYALFTSFFPHLVAGPILRANEFLAHLRPGWMPDRPLAFGEAGFLVARGFLKKLVLADGIGLTIDPFFAHVADSSTAGVWSLPYLYLYSLQIYFDFSGYTDIARGLGLLFGFRWPENFDRPYLATSVQEFWRRWHMTLSRFLRDYLYIPLGGSRCGPLRNAANLMLTMLLGGLWHGASWSFMAWGGLHGGFLVISRLWQGTRLHHRLTALSGAPSTLWRWLCIALTFNAVSLAWCFFRLTQFADSLACLRKSIAFDADKIIVGGVADAALWLPLAVYAAAALAAHFFSRGSSLSEVAAHAEKSPVFAGMLWGASIGILVVALLLAPDRMIRPFIYFQF